MSSAFVLEIRSQRFPVPQTSPERWGCCPRGERRCCSLCCWPKSTRALYANKRAVIGCPRRRGGAGGAPGRGRGPGGVPRPGPGRRVSHGASQKERSRASSAAAPRPARRPSLPASPGSLTTSDGAACATGAAPTRPRCRPPV